MESKKENQLIDLTYAIAACTNVLVANSKNQQASSQLQQLFKKNNINDIHQAIGNLSSPYHAQIALEQFQPRKNSLYNQTTPLFTIYNLFTTHIKPLIDKKDLINFSGTCTATRKHYPNTYALLKYVSYGEQEKADHMVQIHPELSLEKDTITDYLRNTFDNISAVQYAALILDIPMLKMFINHMSVDQKIKAGKQLGELKATKKNCYRAADADRTVSHLQYHFGIISGAYDIASYFGYSWSTALKKISEMQGQLPAHLIKKIFFKNKRCSFTSLSNYLGKKFFLLRGFNSKAYTCNFEIFGISKECVGLYKKYPGAFKEYFGVYGRYNEHADTCKDMQKDIKELVKYILKERPKLAMIKQDLNNLSQEKEVESVCVIS